MMEWVLPTASSFAGEIDGIILLIAVLGGFWLLLAEAIFFYFCFRFRRSRNPKAEYIGGDKKHEKKWIHIPHNLVLLCDIAIIVVAVRVWYNVKQDLPPPDETVRIVAHQWAWRFVHPGPDKILGTDDDVETVDELRVKVDTTYHFKLEAADVMHSFSVPAFRLKQDAVPGREITGWFRPTATGAYDIQCTEICGIGHALMPARIHIQTEAEHNQWLAAQAAGNT